MVPTIGVVIYLVWFGVAIVAAAWCGKLALKPLGDATRRVKAPTRFALSDLLWLAVLIQVAVGSGAAMYRGAETEPARWLVMGFLIAAAVGVWMGAVSTLSRAGVTQFKRRGVFTLVALPLAIAVMIGAIALTFALPMVLFEMSRYSFRATFTDVLWIVGATMGAMVAVVVGVLLVRWLSRWTLAAQ